MGKNIKYEIKTGNFTQVSNTLIKDKNLSMRAKGLFMTIQCYATIPDFTLNKEAILNTCTEGERAFETAWKELKAAGYLKATKVKQDGRFCYEYVLVDNPGKIIPDLQNVGLENVGVETTPDLHFSDLQNVGVVPDLHFEGVQIVGVQNVGLYNNNIYNNNLYINNQSINNNAGLVDKIKSQIIYDSLIDRYDPLMVDEIVEVFRTVYLTPDSEVFRITGITRTAKEVKSVFEKADEENIETILDRVKSGEISFDRNGTKYLISCIFNDVSSVNIKMRSRFARLENEYWENEFLENEIGGL